MLSEKEIEALKTGAYGVTRDGKKVRVISDRGGVALVAVNKEAWEFESYIAFPNYSSSGAMSYMDIVGLWEDKPEPFVLERALAGEPVMLKGNKSHKVYIHRRYNDVGDYIVEYPYTTDYAGLMELNEKFVMWKEPNKFIPVTDLLPKPIKEFGDLTELWRIIIDYEKNKYIPYKYNKGTGWTDVEKIILANGCYYATKEDCQAICDWLMNR